MFHRKNKIQLEILSDVLNSLCEQSRGLGICNIPVTLFHTYRLPKIKVKAYLKRLAQYPNCSEECFIIALIYIERLMCANKNFFVNYNNVHRLIATSVMVATKYYDDQYFHKVYFCRIAGISCKEFYRLEKELLTLLDFDLHVENELFMAWDWRLLGPSQKSGRTKCSGSKFTKPDNSSSFNLSAGTAPVKLSIVRGCQQVVHGYVAKCRENLVSQSICA